MSLFDHKEDQLLGEILKTDENLLLTEERILRLLEQQNQHYSVKVTQKEPSMAIGNIPAGSTGTFAAQLELNGAPTSIPTGSSFVWSASDSTITFAVSSDTTSAVVSVPAGDLGTSAIITAQVVAADGKVYSGSVTVALTPEPQVFTVVVTQTA